MKKFIFRGTVYTDFALFLAAVKAAKDTLVPADFRGQAQRRFKETLDNVTGSGGTIVDLDDQDLADIVDDGSDFLEGAPAQGVRTFAMRQADISGKLLSNTEMTVRLVGARKTNQKSQGGATMVILTFRKHDGSTFSGRTYTTYLESLRTSGSFRQFKIGTDNMPEIAEGSEPIVSINVQKPIANQTYWASVVPADVTEAKAKNAYVHVPTGGRNKGVETVYIQHTTGDANRIEYRSFAEGTPDTVSFTIAENMHRERTESRAKAEGNAEATSIVSRSAADDKAYETETVTRATVKVAAEETLHKLTALKQAYDNGLLEKEEYTAAKARILGM